MRSASLLSCALDKASSNNFRSLAWSTPAALAHAHVTLMRFISALSIASDTFSSKTKCTCSSPSGSAARRATTTLIRATSSLLIACSSSSISNFISRFRSSVNSERAASSNRFSCVAISSTRARTAFFSSPSDGNKWFTRCLNLSGCQRNNPASNCLHTISGPQSKSMRRRFSGGPAGQGISLNRSLGAAPSSPAAAPSFDKIETFLSKAVQHASSPTSSNS
mmetsp:Transcript_99708/g.222799  ORF Transcript_99708/g.222799 Transcript_99708/m.222799 type:complete len:222 (-) Transcript_99708:44-709(-)